MDDYHKELLAEIIQKWDILKIEEYIIQLEQRRIKLDDWIKHLKTLRKKKARRPVDTGARGGI